MTEFILSHMNRKDGLFFAYYDSIPKRLGEDYEKWSDQSGSFHAKLALLFIDLWRETRNPKLRDVTRRLLDTYLKLQKHNGRFITSLLDNSTHLHPHCYTMEGLVYAYYHLGWKWYAAPLKKAMRWTLEAVGEDGSISTFFKDRRFDFHERSDIVAQVLRMGSLLYGLGIYRDTALKKRLERIYCHLELFIYKGQGKQNGGILYGAATDGLVRMHLNTWCGMFAIQALTMYENFVKNKNEVVLEQLI